MSIEEKFKLQIAFLFGPLVVLLLLCNSASATPKDVMDGAVKSYMAGSVLDAENALQAGLVSATDPAEQWAMIDLLTDLCSYAYDAECITASIKPMQTIAQKLNNPKLTAGKVAFVLLFDLYLTNNTQFLKSQNNLDFSLKIATPLINPVIATRLFLLNAVIVQETGDFSGAHRYLDRAFTTFLQIDPNTHSFESATLLKSLVAAAILNHDIARALRWMVAGAPLIQAGLPQNSYDYADYMNIQTQLGAQFNTAPDVIDKAMKDTMVRINALQLRPGVKDLMTSSLAINEAAYLSLHSDRDSMTKAFQSAPLFAKRNDVIKRGAFSNPIELLYATAEIFFDVLDGKAPDQRWQPLFENLPNWIVSSDIRVQDDIFNKMARAFLEAKANRSSAIQLIEDATRADLAQYEIVRGDLKAFQFPSLLDRVLLTISMGTISREPNPGNGDLLVEELELLNRNPRYVISDTLTALSEQQTVEQRHAAHALLRLIDHQQDWEITQLKVLVQRRGTPSAKGQPVDFSPELSAINFADSQDRLFKAVIPPSTTLPRLSELQAALRPREAFVGYASGFRVCVGKTGIQTSLNSADEKQLLLDVKLMNAALSAQNGPSDELDSQYPVAASMRLYHTLFDGLDECLHDVQHLVFFPTSDVASVPLAALLKDAPQKLGGGYDLANAHWLLFDFAVSTVTSIEDFLAARRLSQHLSAQQSTLAFAGIGDPALGESPQSIKNLQPLPETRTEVETISKMFSGITELRTGSEATEEAFRSMPLDQFEVLHFATHGISVDDKNEGSQAALVFTAGDVNNPFDDGLLTTSDVANLNLSARLVVLSACNTANFDLSKFSSQLQGLASAFTVAGAPTTVASLWAVNSQVSLKLMTNFYRAMLGPRHDDVAVAMQEAMIEVLHDHSSSAFANPRFWAPFIVIGDGGENISHGTVSPDYDDQVQLSRSGGGIVGLEPTSSGYVTSVTGPEENGRHVSLIQQSPPKSWILKDSQIAAGEVVQWKDQTFAAGSTWEGKSIPVIRSISAFGKLVWQKVISSRFDSAEISALAVGPEGLILVVSPFGSSDKIDFDLIRLDVSGKEVGRAKETLDIPKSQLTVQRVQYSAALSGGKLIVSANYGPTQSAPVRNDFGYASFCSSGSGTHVFAYESKTLAPKQDINITDIRIRALKSTSTGVIFGGGQQEQCVLNGEKAVLGRLSSDLNSQIVWKDSGPFYSELVGVASIGNVVSGVENISEPLDIPLYPTNYFQQASVNPKYISLSDASLSEAVLITFATDGSVEAKRFLGNGLPQFANGISNVDKKLIVFGEDGFNPWIRAFH